MGVYNTVSNSFKEAIMIIKNYVSDELANKVYHLTQALIQAEKIVKSLQEENDHLKEIIEQEQNALLCAVGE
jgi:thymidine phosphorylase